MAPGTLSSERMLRQHGERRARVVLRPPSPPTLPLNPPLLTFGRTPGATLNLLRTRNGIVGPLS
jgi:hypothetical protein